MDFLIRSSDELEIALQIAASNGEEDILKLQEGIYFGNFLFVTQEDHKLSIIGGFDANFENRANSPQASILDGGEANRVLTLMSTQNSVDFDIQNLTLQNGSTEPIGLYDEGGAIRVETLGQVYISDTIITENYAYRGAAIFSNADTVINQSVVQKNSAHTAAIKVDNADLTVTNSLLTDNIGTYHGSIYVEDSGFFRNNPQHVTSISESIISNNIGAAVYTHSNAVISNNYILENGEGLYLRSEAQVTGNVIYNNENRAITASANVLIASNTVVGNGGGLLLFLHDDAESAIVVNNVFQGNYGGPPYGGKELRDIFILNDVNDNFVPSDVTILNNNLGMIDDDFYIQRPIAIDQSNTFASVDFVDKETNDFRLVTSSPFIDAGNSSHASSELDLNGSDRIAGLAIDIGAVEHDLTEKRLYLNSSVLENIALHFTESSGQSTTSYIEKFQSTVEIPSFSYVMLDSSTYSADIAISDVISSLKHIVGLETLDGAALHAADVDNDDTVAIADVISQLKHIVGLETLDTFDLVDTAGARVTEITEETTDLQLVLNGDVDLSTALNSEYAYQV